jgi:hypothetical protein
MGACSGRIIAKSRKNFTTKLVGSGKLLFDLSRNSEDAMAVYALWNNKGGVGKSYLTFQIACEYAHTSGSKGALRVNRGGARLRVTSKSGYVVPMAALRLGLILS